MRSRVCSSPGARDRRASPRPRPRPAPWPPPPEHAMNFSYDARRRLLSKLVVGFCGAAVVAALIPLGLILFFILMKGLPALNLDFFTQTPKPVGEKGGGMGNAMVGTL